MQFEDEFGREGLTAALHESLVREGLAFLEHEVQETVAQEFGQQPGMQRTGEREVLGFLGAASQVRLPGLQGGAGAGGSAAAHKHLLGQAVIGAFVQRLCAGRATPGRRCVSSTRGRIRSLSSARFSSA